jgi:hypothetical protein
MLKVWRQSYRRMTRAIGSTRPICGDGGQEVSHGTPADPISISELLETGRDTFALTLRRTDAAGTRMLHV